MPLLWRSLPPRGLKRHRGTAFCLCPPRPHTSCRFSLRENTRARRASVKRWVHLATGRAVPGRVFRSSRGSPTRPLQSRRSGAPEPVPPGNRRCLSPCVLDRGRDLAGMDVSVTAHRPNPPGRGTPSATPVSAPDGDVPCSLYLHGFMPAVCLSPLGFGLPGRCVAILWSRSPGLQIVSIGQG